MKRWIALVGVAVMALALTPAAGVTAAPADRDVIPGSYIVVLDTSHPSQVASEHARRHGAVIGYVYEHALAGYSARLSSTAVRAIARDPRVKSVEPETLHAIDAQTLPIGIDRIDVDRNPTVSTDGTGSKVVNIPVAVIDTGVAEHPDLNILGRVDCTVLTGGRMFGTYGCVEGQGGDGNGHGTHVAGTVGAKDNGAGVVGVAPGAPIWSVKVCPTNSCPQGAIIAGIDWVAGKKKGTSSGKVDFAAANFSISSADSDNACTNPADATHRAICGLVDTGVVFVMSAGNDGRLKTPYPITLSVSAIADFDGQPGGLGSPTCRSDTDDTLANFSNHGPKVRIAAPGVCILSTWTNSGYNTISGTSMAAPHVTGAVALYLHSNAARAPATSAAGVRAIEVAIIAAAHAQGTANRPCSYDDVRPGGPLLFVNALSFGGDGGCGSGGGTGGEDPGDPVDPVDPVEPGDPVYELNLAGSSTTSGPWWRPSVTATLTDQGAAAGGITVVGSWSGAISGSGSCVTGTNGSCTIDLGRTRSPGVVEFQTSTPVVASITVSP